MNKFVIDASVFAKIVFRESGFKEILDYLDEAFKKSGKPNFSAPTLFYFEIGNVTLQKGIFQVKDLRSITSLMVVYDIHLISADESEWEDIVQRAHFSRTTFYDMSYYYLAEKTGAVYLTCDQKFVQRLSDKQKSRVRLFS